MVPTRSHLSCRGSRAFALPELVMLVVVLALFAAVSVVLSSRTRSLGSLGVSMSNLRQVGAWAASYASDNQERFAGFSWQPGVITPSEYADLRGPFPDALSAAGAQATDIIRRLSGLTVAQTPRPANWIPHLLYQHLPLLDHAGAAFPDFALISPEDANRLDWANDPEGFLINRFRERQPSPQSGGFRWIFSSSYETSLSTCQAGDGTTILPAGTHNTYSISAGSATLPQRRVDETRYPAAKALRWDSHQRHFGQRAAYFMAPEARVPVQFVDGHVAVRATTDANRGWNPAQPSSPASTTVRYEPLSWEPRVPPPGTTSATYAGVYRWTRRGLNGRDFDGPETP